MKRNEYKLLVENWNNYLTLEEKRLTREHVLAESFLLNEGINIKKLANNLKTSVSALVLFLAAKAANATPGEIKDDPSHLNNLNPEVSSVINDASAEDVKDANKIIDGSLKGTYDSKNDINKLVKTIVTKTGSGSIFGSKTNTTRGKIMSVRTITPEEQEVISLLKLFDNDSESFLNAIEDDRNKSLLCSHGYCFAQWKDKDSTKYALYSPLGHEFLNGTGSGIDEIPKGSAVSIHKKLYSSPSDKYTKDLSARYRALNQYEDEGISKWGNFTNKIVEGYKLAWKAARLSKIKTASKTFNVLFDSIKKGKIDITDVLDKTLDKNFKAWFDGLKNSWIKTIKSLLEEEMISKNAAESLASELESLSDISDFADWLNDLEKAGLEGIFNKKDIADVIDMYKEKNL